MVAHRPNRSRAISIEAGKGNPINRGRITSGRNNGFASTDTVLTFARQRIRVVQFYWLPRVSTTAEA